MPLPSIAFSITRLWLPWSATEVCRSTPGPMLPAISLCVMRLAVPPVRLTPTKREPDMALRSTRLFEDSTRPMPVKLAVIFMSTTWLCRTPARRTP
jgi:hypothetical protein